MPLNRRHFIKASGLSVLPGFLSALPITGLARDPNPAPADEQVVKLFFDGVDFPAAAYWEQLEQFNKKRPIKADIYGQGGVVEELEKKMASITGKEKAIYMPSGTMANQLAIAVLSGEKTKVFVQDNSHVFRDEADAAQSVFNKRLMPIIGNKTYFTAAELKQSIESLDQEEVFKSGIGCVSIENPVRRSDGRFVPLQEIKKISDYCNARKIPMHLDGARIFMTAAWTGIPVRKYADQFDTVYISLYKYLGASGGAILCGSSEVISKMPHLIKIHGGNMFGNWLIAAMALHRLDGFEDRLKESIQRSKTIFASLNRLPGVSVTPIEGGTNIYQMKTPPGLQVSKFMEELTKASIRMPRPANDGSVKITVNESLLYREPEYIVNSIKVAIEKAKG